MRHLIFALMIVLLPLRGWTGDAMATQMASHAIAIESVAGDAHKMVATASFDHHNLAFEKSQASHDCQDQATDGRGTDQTSNAENCGACQACQACHTVALSPSPLEVAASFASPQLRPSHAAAFTSAAGALGQKPPIS